MLLSWTGSKLLPVKHMNVRQAHSALPHQYLERIAAAGTSQAVSSASPERFSGDACRIDLPSVELWMHQEALQMEAAEHQEDSF